jgi:HlyD family secretion protein/adhesin transport system membrane fusion protein
VFEDGAIQAQLKRRLTQPLALEDGRPPRVLTATLLACSGFIMLAVVWSALAEVQEVTIAPGQIVPRGQIQSVQHLEGGIVAEIFVREGATVATHQPLIRLQPEAAVSDRNQLESRRANLRLQVIRLEAEERGEMPDFGNLAREFPDLTAEQEKLYVSAVTRQRQERATLRAKIAQRSSEIETLAADLETAQAQVTVQMELFGIQEGLAKSGVGARKNWLDAKVLLQRAQGEENSLRSKLVSAQEVLTEAKSSLEETQAKEVQKLSEERTKAAADQSETEQQLIKITDRFTRLIVRAPSDGVVQELVPKALGEVVRPGDLVARIVPTGSELVAEVRIDPKDSGHVRVGSPAEIRLATFDSAIFGTLLGKIDHISATTFAPTPGQSASFGQSPGQSAGDPYYKARISLFSYNMGNGAMSHPITAGMTLQARINTGSKSILRYMFKPVMNSIDLAFSER